MEEHDYRVFPKISFAITVFAILMILVPTIIDIIDYGAWQFFTVLVTTDAQTGNILGRVLWDILWIFGASNSLYPFYAVLGAITSCFCGIKTTITWVKVVSFIMLGFFAIVLLPVLVIIVFSIFF